VAQAPLRVPRAQQPPATQFFNIPPDRVVEVGMQIEF
jgi:K+ transporter